MDEIYKNKISKNILVVFLTACICSYYLPWKWTSFLLLPLYLFALFERKHICIEKQLKQVFCLIVMYIAFYTITSNVPNASLKGGYDVLRGLFLFPVGIAFARWVEDKASWMNVNAVVLLFLFGSLFFPQRGGQYYSYFINPNNAAVLLIIFICFLVPPFSKKIFNLGMVPSLLGLTLGLYLFFLTNGRGAWLGLTMAVFILLLKSNKVKGFVKIFMSLTVVSIFSVCFFYFNTKGFSLNLREGIWSGLYNYTWNENILFGFGFNGTKALMRQLDLFTVTAHNVFLELFVTTGLVGLLAIFFIACLTLIVFVRYRYKHNHIVVAGLIAVISFWVMGQFDLKFSSFRFFATNAFFLGMVYSQRLDKPHRAKEVGDG